MVGIVLEFSLMIFVVVLFSVIIELFFEIVFRLIEIFSLFNLDFRYKNVFK